MSASTKTKKFKSYQTAFSTYKETINSFHKLFDNFTNSILVVSYSANSLPTKDEMVKIINNYKKQVEVVSINYKYRINSQNNAKSNNTVQEYIFVGY